MSQGEQPAETFISQLSQGEQPTYISPLSVGLASLALLVNGAVSLHLALNLHTQLLIAAIRSVVQLSLLGTILVPIFNSGQWYTVALYGTWPICL